MFENVGAGKSYKDKKKTEGTRKKKKWNKDNSPFSNYLTSVTSNLDCYKQTNKQIMTELLLYYHSFRKMFFTFDFYLYKSIQFHRSM